MNKKYAGMTGLFVLLVFGGTVAGLVSHGREFSDRENRYLQQRPQWDTDQVLSGEYQSQYEDYLNDQFPARDALMKLSVYAQKYAGSTRINGVYLGKDGYLLEEPAQIGSDPGEYDDPHRVSEPGGEDVWEGEGVLCDGAVQDCGTSEETS